MIWLFAARSLRLATTSRDKEIDTRKEEKRGKEEKESGDPEVLGIKRN